MRHVLVETNWVFAFAAPAHHKRSDAVELFDRACRDEIQLHVPSLCLIEAGQPIMMKCQPRHKADAIRQFLLSAKSAGDISAEQEKATRYVLDQYEQRVRFELRRLDEIISGPRKTPGIEVFPLNERMLSRAVELAEKSLSLGPFDQAVLAAVLVRAEELRDKGETDLCFCELDSDFQPWDRNGESKYPLTDFYDSALVWVYGDFSLSRPERPNAWPATRDS